MSTLYFEAEAAYRRERALQTIRGIRLSRQARAARRAGATADPRARATVARPASC